MSFRIISSVNMLVNTMLQISRTLVSSSGWTEAAGEGAKKKQEKLAETLKQIKRN